MKRAFKRFAMIMAGVAAILFAPVPARAADSALDIIGNAWRIRAEAAKTKLAGPGLDECDKAVERAYQHYRESVSGKKRMFELKIELAGQTMLVSYAYEGQRLSDFLLVTLPPRWMVVQKPESQTVSILIAGLDCAFDLCTNDPFMAGPCAENPAK